MYRLRNVFINLIICLLPVLATGGQFFGAELTYRLISGNGGSYTYEITLKVYRECLNPAEFDLPVLKILNTLDIAKNTHPITYRELQLNNPVLTLLPKTKLDYCIINEPQTCVEQYVFQAFVDLPESPEGYTIYYNSCCRNGVSNLINSSGNSDSELIYNVPVSGQAFTFAAFIPAQNINLNNSPASFADSVVLACKGKPFFYRIQYRDADGDSIVIKPAAPLSKISAATTTFPPLSFLPGYSINQPLGNGVFINSSGDISGIPQTTGWFALALHIEEYRNGRLINHNRKDYQLNVFDCDIKQTNEVVNCETNAALFEHANNSTNNFYWDFGVPDYSTDTSTAKGPVYLYPKNGTFDVKLVVENTLGGCKDSVFTIAKIYPGALKPDFEWTGIACEGYPLSFADKSQVIAGTSILSYLWRIQNTDTIIGGTPDVRYTPPVSGLLPYPLAVELTVHSDLGCSARKLKDILIYEKVVADAGPDRILSFGDEYTINGATTERNATYNWLPAFGLSDASIRNPVVRANRDIEYLLKVENPGGCSSTDTVRFRYMKGPEIYVATAFTPNGDGLNDVLHFFPVGMESAIFTIYNRWGKLVFSSADSQLGWDGKLRNVSQDAGLFFWTVQAKDLQGNKILKKGYVQLIR